MAGVSTPGMAAAVSGAGALGSLGIGALPIDGARGLINAFRQRCDGPLNVNVFCQAPATADLVLKTAWAARLDPNFAHSSAAPPARLSEIYRSFVADGPMLEALVAEKPRVVSFHFGLPPRD